ncbi:MAG: DUF4012 domain-containing protein [Ktedonobacterales bacterium]
MKQSEQWEDMPTVPMPAPSQRVERGDDLEAVYDALTVPMLAPGPGLVRGDAHDAVSDAPTVPMPGLGGKTARPGLYGLLHRLKLPASILKTSRGLRLLLVVLILFTFAGLSIGGWVNATAQLQRMRTLAHDGLQHLEDVRALVSLNHIDQALNNTTLNKVQAELSAAEQDFGPLRRMLAQPQGTFAVASHLPWTGSVLASAEYLAAAADELCLAGGDFAQDGRLALQILQGGLFASSHVATASTSGSSPSAGDPPPPPVLDTASYNQLRAGLAAGFAHLQSAVGYALRADLSVLPSSLVKPQQVAEVRQLLAKWPQILTVVGQVNTALDVLPNVLGLDSPSKYLIELMDSTEMRPGGGFIGNYAIMTVVNGKIQPLTISDTYLLDSPYLESHGDVSPAPQQYSWWQYNTIYGLRDSNLSGDFPTSAKLGMQQLVREGGPTVQGVIAVTPAAIEGVIHILGPIALPQYGQVVTDTNLEHLIHLYELVPSEQPLAPLPSSEQISSPTKRFTALLGQALLQKLHSLSLSEQITIGKDLIASVHSKDIQVYVSDPTGEGLLATYHIDGAFPKAPVDSVSIVDANVSGNKGSQFVTVAESDDVVLDSQGTATHHLTLTYRFDVTNPTELYGPDYYLTYLRIYAPATAQLLSLQGFTNFNSDDRIGRSDQPGYQMWGGYLLIQDGTSYTLYLSWRVPHAALHFANGRYTYALEYTHQAGLQQALSTVVGVPASSRPAYQYTGDLDGDKLIYIAYNG